MTEDHVRRPSLGDCANLNLGLMLSRLLKSEPVSRLS